jgi:ATP-dependent DNA ligase
MEAREVDTIPTGTGWLYEPKWDGFRCLAFKAGDHVYLQSKSGQPLARYFPEVVAALRELAANKAVIDGELTMTRKGDTFDDLLQRIHPAESRVQMLAKKTPATLVVFDLLVDDRGASLAKMPLSKRRPRLEAFAEKYLKGRPLLRLSEATTKLAVVRKWFAKVGGALDGIVAKRLDAAYRSDDQNAMVKVKHERTADCVVGGFRYASKGGVVGSLLLGLYDDEGLLDHVGFTSSMKHSDRRALTTKLKKLIKPPGFTGGKPGGPSRWSTERSEQWEPLATKLVVEVAYDHVTGNRFRHGTRLLRWRSDKRPKQCTLDQIRRVRGAATVEKLTR